MISFTHVCRGGNLKMDFVTLTTAVGGDKEHLARHHQELVRRAERIFKCRIISIVIRTGEGNGVLHLIWAIESLRFKNNFRVYIPQAWLSKEWEKIHGAHRVDIRLVNSTGQDCKRLSLYCVNQYFAGQSAIERSSYSYKKLGVTLGKTWAWFKFEMRKYLVQEALGGLVRLGSPTGVDIDKWTMYKAWEDLLMKKSCIVADEFFYLENGVYGSF
jgi:hypothetical protein